MRTHHLVAILPSVLFVACAGGGDIYRGPETPASITGPATLVPVDPQLPSADRHLRDIRQDAGDFASARVRLCVAPNGHVDTVDLLRHSSSRTFDDAVVNDIADWHFTGEAPTPLHPDTCETATIRYHIPS